MSEKKHARIPAGFGRLRCGGCGNGTVRLYASGRHEFTEIRAVCTKCKDITIIGVPQPTITVEWHPDAKGILCGGWGKKP